MRAEVGAIFAGLLALALIVPGLASAAPASPSTSAPPGATALASDAVPVPAGVVPEPLSGLLPLTITVDLVPQNLSALGELVAALGSNPADRGRALSESEFEREFSPSRTATDVVSEFLIEHGAVGIQSTPDRLGIRAVLPAGSVETAFGVDLVRLGGPDARPTYTALGSPLLPDSVRPYVAGIGGLSNAGNAGFSLHLARVPGSAPQPTR